MSNANSLEDVAYSYWTKMRSRVPSQWVNWFEPFATGQFEWYYKQRGFNTLEEFITATATRGGLGLTMGQFKFLLTYNPDYKHIWQPIVDKMKLQDVVSVSAIGEPNHVGNRYTVLDADKNKNISIKDYGTSKTYRIAKLKRDFGEDAVNEAAKSFKTAAALERHFGVGKPLLTPVEKMMAAYNRLSDDDKLEFNELMEMEVA